MRVKGMEFDKYFENEIRKGPKLRRARREMQWDMALATSRVAESLRIGAGLKQAEMAKRSGMTQPSVARAESSGCSVSTLSRMARAVGKRIVISIGDSEH